ncbi:Rossmann-like and DUF2520 domain-containing protein [Maricurvus nonylphenolicus]|uniref:Rossmann-like and DUF2520 domain-containing protein n=1 Tax=Maricurvus nonylphenolicus TaxID=1008307 RepID=UPI0036F2F6F7
MTSTTPPLPTLQLIGGGKLGRTLSRLWHDKGYFSINQILTRNETTANEAQDFIAGGHALWRWSELSAPPQPCLWLIAVADSQLAEAAHTLSQQQLVKPGDVVFHCSGATSSTILKPLQDQGAYTASIHPVHSFANPEKSLSSFAGSHCAYEGDRQALTQLLPAFEALGAELFEVSAKHKSLYHAGSVMACNYLVALLDASFASFAAAGVERERASQLLAPLVHQTADNVFNTSPQAALTGPISRGDHTTVEQQLQALEKLNPEIAKLYNQLGQQTLHIAEQQQQATPEDLQRIQALLDDGKN